LFVLSGNGGSFFNNVELDVAVGGKVRRDSTVGSVGSSSSTDGSLSADVRDLAFLNIETLGLSVRLEVDEESLNVLDGLGWESTVVMVDILAHSVSTWTTGESSEWNDSFVLSDLIHVLDGLDEVHASASSGSLIGVLEMCSQVIDLAFSGYKNKSTLKSATNNRLAGLFTNCLFKHRLRRDLKEQACLHLVGSAGCLEYLTIGNL